MGRTNKSIFQDAKPVSAFSLKLLKISLRGLEQGWISSQLARLGPARAGSAQLVEDRRQATASDKADEPVQMLMKGKIFLTIPAESIMSRAVPGKLACHEFLYPVLIGAMQQL